MFFFYRNTECPTNVNLIAYIEKDSSAEESTVRDEYSNSNNKLSPSLATEHNADSQNKPSFTTQDTVINSKFTPIIDLPPTNRYDSAALNNSPIIIRERTNGNEVEQVQVELKKSSSLEISNEHNFGEGLQSIIIMQDSLKHNEEEKISAVMMSSDQIQNSILELSDEKGLVQPSEQLIEAPTSSHSKEQYPAGEIKVSPALNDDSFEQKETTASKLTLENEDGWIVNRKASALKESEAVLTSNQSTEAPSSLPAKCDSKIESSNVEINSNRNDRLPFTSTAASGATGSIVNAANRITPSVVRFDIAKETAAPKDDEFGEDILSDNSSGKKQSYSIRVAPSIGSANSANVQFNHEGEKASPMRKMLKRKFGTPFVAAVKDGLQLFPPPAPKRSPAQEKQQEQDQELEQEQVEEAEFDHLATSSSLSTSNLLIRKEVHDKYLLYDFYNL